MMLMIGMLLNYTKLNRDSIDSIELANPDRHLKRFGAGTLTKCLYQFDDPVSPHLAAKDKVVCSTRLKPMIVKLISPDSTRR
jgi:hypothetical protein